MLKSNISLQGKFLKATPLLNNTYFEAATIFITEHNQDGAIGYIINQPYPRRFNELIEFIDSPPIQLYEGGPVEQEKLFILHKKHQLITDSTHITETIYSGGDFKQAVRLINNNTLTSNDYKLFIGYCGWDTDELEAEIKEGSWTVLHHAEIFL